MNIRSSLLRLLALAGVIGVSLSSHAANLVVTNLADSGPGSLRNAVAIANTNADPDIITFDAAFSGQYIVLDSQLLLSNQVTIDASGLANGINITTGAAGISGNTRLFEVGDNAVVELTRLTILGGHAFVPAGGDFLSGNGGGILVNADGGTLTLNHCILAYNSAQSDGGAIAIIINADFVVTLNHCTVSHNAAQNGGGISARGGQLTVNSCTFTGNTATFEGGAIGAIQGNTVTINNSSIHNNSALNAGGGIAGTQPIINNSTIAGNFARFGGGLRGNGARLTNCTVSGNAAYVAEGGASVPISINSLVNSILAGNTAPFNSNFSKLNGVVSNSLTNGNPLLAPLGDYGGPTFTRPPLAGSPALDAGDDSVTNSLATDQRGLPRQVGAHVDIGAVESQVANAASAPVLTLAFTNGPDTDFTVWATTNVALPTEQWSILGLATENPPGQYRFTEYPRRFYQVTSP